MPLPTALEDTLVAVGALMRDAHDPWWIITGAAAAIHGVSPIRVADVDLLLSVQDARQVLREIGIAPTRGAKSDRFRSLIFATWRETPLTVEFMAGFCHRERNRWVAVKPITRRPINVHGETVYVPERSELKAMFERFGRPKDIERVELLSAQRVL
jgi:hypothetical protein